MKTKLLSCILLSAMALGATQAFAQKLDAPVAAKEDLMTFAGVEYQVSVDDKGEKTYTILDSSKEGAQEIYQAARKTTAASTSFGKRTPSPSLPRRKSWPLILRTASTAWCSLTANSLASPWTSCRRSCGIR